MAAACIYAALSGRVVARFTAITEKNHMKIGIIALGRLGGGIAHCKAALGHASSFGVHNETEEQPVKL